MFINKKAPVFILLSFLVIIIFGGDIMADTKNTPQSINRFSLDLYSRLRTESGSFSFSPYSIETALAMAYAGAGGKTASQIQQTLHLEHNPKETHANMAALIKLLNKPPLFVANALWGQKGYVLKEAFVNTLKNQYQSEIKLLDFISEPEKSCSIINQWVEDKTNNKIKKMLQPKSISSLTRLILTNAIYFKADWKYSFKKEATHEEPFHVSPREKTNIPMMHQTEQFPYYENDALQMIEMPYKQNNLSMLIILPKKIDGLNQIESALKLESLEKWIKDLKSEEVILSLPKFKVSSEFLLNDPLISLGMKDAFSFPPADFFGIAGEKEDLYIEQVIHKVYVAVDEKGTEAAAATAVVFSQLLARLSKSKVFNADHPFMLLIKDNQTETILFIGRFVGDPSLRSG